MSPDEKPQRMVAIHGHLYQPPREDPWSGEVAVESSAAPSHDWNERITNECYRPNAQAKFGDQLRNNYEGASFDVGPTLTAWMQRHAADVLAAIVAADQANHAVTGHGPAIAHPWVHAILPLCNAADKKTLIHWGIADFEHRFGRDPEGMWLPETAMDLDTLVALHDAGIAYTIAAPSQIAAVRGVSGEWLLGSGTGNPVKIALPGNRTIIAMPYHGELSNLVAFGGALNDGLRFAADLEAVASTRESVIVATDMESYGHHHRFGEMALAATIDALRSRPDVRLATVSEIVAGVVAVDGVAALPSAWSCAHGIERWRSDCGCKLGPDTVHNQSWRAPLRSALDSLRDAVGQLHELTRDLIDPVGARNDYCKVMLEPDTWPKFVERHLTPYGDAPRARAYLELQRHLLMMYSSCGWFFDDAAGHETLIVLRHARRGIELVRDLYGLDCEPEFVSRLAPMVSDVHGLDGRDIWNRFTHST